MIKKRGKLKKRRRELPAISDEHFNSFNKIRQRYKATWEETFARFHNYEDWVEHLFSMSKKPTETDKVNAVTVTYLLPIWLDMIYQNFVKENINIHGLDELSNTETGATAVIIAAGPSLHDNNNLERLRDSAFYKDKKGIIITTGHTLKDCINADIIPDYMILIDSEEIEADWIDIDEKHMKNITGIFVPSVHPKVLERWKGEKYFYMSNIPQKTIPNVQAVLEGLLPMFTLFDGGSNVGTIAWNIARYMGCTTMVLLGLDFSFKADTPLQETPYYGAFRRSYKSDEEMFKNAYRIHTHSFFKSNCFTDSMFDNFMKNAVFLFKKSQKKEGTKTINCSPGIIDDPKIKNMWFKDWLGEWEK